MELLGLPDFLNNWRKQTKLFQYVKLSYWVFVASSTAGVMTFGWQLKQIFLATGNLKLTLVIAIGDALVNASAAVIAVWAASSLVKDSPLPLMVTGLLARLRAGQEVLPDIPASETSSQKEKDSLPSAS
jgi:hypothetical protein